MRWRSVPDPVWRMAATVLVLAWAVALAQGRSLANAFTMESGAATAAALVTAGAVVVGFGATDRRLGVLALGTGAIWLTSALAPGLGGDVWPRALAAGGRTLTLPAALLVVYLGANDRGFDRRRRWLVLSIILSGALAVMTAATWNPFYAPASACVVDCWDVPALLDPGPAGGRLLRLATAGETAAAATGLVLVGVSALRRRSGRERTSMLLFGLGAALIGLPALGDILVTFTRSASGIGRSDIFIAQALTWLRPGTVVGVLFVACGLVHRSLRASIARARVGAIGAEIDAAPPIGTLGAALSEALDDPSVRVGYARPDGQGYVDARGEPLSLGSTPSQDSLTYIRRAGQEVAVVAHREGLAATDVTEELRPSFLLALDNERLRAVRLAQLRELRASRADVVTASDGERQRIERDLHDGAQQQLLAIAIRLKLARLEAERIGAPELAGRLAAAEGDARDAMDGLRRVSRGVFPGVLERSGLIPALRSLAEDAIVRLEVEGVLPVRCSWPAETTAYDVVARSMVAAAGDGPGDMVVRLAVSEECLVLEVIGPAALQDPRYLQAVEDRVSAAVGVVKVSPLTAGGMRVHVTLPCA